MNKEDMDPLNYSYLSIDDMSKQLEYLCKCGQESTHGAHGVRDNEVFSEYFCQKCYNNKK